MKLLRVSTLDRNSLIFARCRAQRRGSGLNEWGKSHLPTAIRWGHSEVAVLHRPVYASFGCYQMVSPWAGILLSAILFSPRSLLPGQMHTNAFRSSTDKEWTRFRGSNVSGCLVKWCTYVRVPRRNFHLKSKCRSCCYCSFLVSFPDRGANWPNIVPAPRSFCHQSVTVTKQYCHSINKINA